MKFIAILILALTSWTLLGQDYSIEYKTVQVTNWIQPGPFLRLVNGQKYNIAYSQLWGQPSGGRTEDDNTGHFIRYDIIPENIDGNKTFCEMYAIQWWYDYYGRPKDEDRWFVKKIVVYHAPENIILGKPFKFTCMKVDDFVIGNRFICDAYDCGTQDTNPIPVLKSIRVRVN